MCKRNYFVGSANSLAFYFCFSLKNFFLKREKLVDATDSLKIIMGSLRIAISLNFGQKIWNTFDFIYCAQSHWSSCQSYNNSRNSEQRKRGRKRRKGSYRRKNSNRDVCKGPVQAFMGPGSALAPSFELLSNIFSFPVTLTPPPANFPPTDALRLSLLGVEQSPGKNKELSPQVRMPKLAQKAHFKEKKKISY